MRCRLISYDFYSLSKFRLYLSTTIIVFTFHTNNAMTPNFPLLLEPKWFNFANEKEPQDTGIYMHMSSVYYLTIYLSINKSFS